MSKRSVQRNQQTILVKIAHDETKQSYGYICLAKHLQAQGVKISMYAVRQIKKLKELYCKHHKRSKRTTKSDLRKFTRATVFHDSAELCMVK